MMENAPNVSGLSGASAAPATIDIGEPVADVTERLADGHRAAGATVGIRRAHPAQAELDGDVRVRRPAEDLQGERLVDPARALLQKMRVLELRARDAAQRRAEADPHAGLRVLRGVVEPRVFAAPVWRSPRQTARSGPAA